MEIDTPILQFCRKYGAGTKRQQMIFQMIADGHPIQEIADELGTTKVSIDNSLRKFYKHNGFRGRNDVMSEIYKSVLYELTETDSQKKLDEIKRILG